MRTTVSISEHLLTAAKQRAHERGQTLGDVVDDALRHELARDVEPAPRPPVPVLRAGGGPRPGVDLTLNRAMVQVLDEGLELDRLR